MANDTFNYTGNLPWLKARTILYVVHGSRAYGTSTPESDYDYKGVVVPPREYRDGYIHRFEQADFKPGDNAEATIYELRKFFALAADCNPNICEVLWVHPSDRLICTEAGQLLVDNRARFLSKKVVHTFRGYACAQMKRIKTHRKWLLNPPDHAPTRTEYGLPERTVIPADQLAAAMAAVQKRVDGWEIDFGDLSEATKIYIQEQMTKYLAEIAVGTDEKFRAAGRLLGYADNFLDLMDKERHYNTAHREWTQFQEWKTKRNPARAALEAKYGLDTKHAAHLCRLLRMCREILTEGVVNVRRPDAAEILAIRNGAWSYDKLLAWAEEEDVALLEVAKASSLPRGPDHVFLDNLCMEITTKIGG